MEKGFHFWVQNILGPAPQKKDGYIEIAIKNAKEIISKMSGILHCNST